LGNRISSQVQQVTGLRGSGLRVSLVFAGNPLEVAGKLVLASRVSRVVGHESLGHGLHGFWVLSHPGHLWFLASPEIAPSAPPMSSGSAVVDPLVGSHLVVH